MSLTNNEIERYSRQIILKDIGISGQKKLKKSKVLIIGLGGLGCPAAEYLSRAGVGTIGLIDHDKINLSNIHRQSIFTTCDIKKYKVDVVKQRIKRKLSKRVFYPDTDTVKSPWNNINRAFMEVENLGIKLEDEGNKEDLEFLYKIKDLLEKIEKEFK